MPGLLIKELLIRGDLDRCMIVCPGIVLDAGGAATGTIVAQGNNQKAAWELWRASPPYSPAPVVTQAGSYTFNVGRADGFIFGVGGGAVRVSGVLNNAPADGRSVFQRYTVMARQ